MGTRVDAGSVRIPAWVKDLDSFRCWARSDDYPERGWFSHLQGELWLDLSMERYPHNQLKTIIGAAVTNLVVQGRLGHYFSDRMLLTHLGAELSTEPDGMFVSREALRDGRVQLEGGADSVEVLGTPDMVLEVVSRSSARKDTVVLRKLYHLAEVPEYWLADSRKDRATFMILRRTKSGYTAVRAQGGWLKSGVFGKSFRLTQELGEQDLPEYRLEVR